MNQDAIDRLKHRLLQSGPALTITMGATFLGTLPTFAAACKALTWAADYSNQAAQKHERPGQEPRGAGTSAMRNGLTVLFLHGTPFGF